MDLYDRLIAINEDNGYAGLTGNTALGCWCVVN